MEIKLFNSWYFIWIAISIVSVLLLFLILRKRKEKTKKITLFVILALGLALHFLKVLIPPYSTNQTVWLRESWFINICAANIFLFPFIFLTKSKRLKDYMFYIGVISGIIAVFYPVEPMEKANQLAEMYDIIRFYIHHTMLWGVPMLMVLLKLHKLALKRILWVPATFMCVLGFIMLNQVLQSELGFVPLRDGDFLDVGYKNPSMIWGPSGEIGEIFKLFCPDFFARVPVGPNAGAVKYWPWFWLICPAYILITPLCFVLCLIFRGKNKSQQEQTK